MVSRKGSGTSASSGLKKLLSSLSQSTKQRLGRFRCYSMEQLPAPRGSPGVERSPSLQSLVSPKCCGGHGEGGAGAVLPLGGERRGVKCREPNGKW